MEKIQMQGVPETMLQTLYARAAYSGQQNAKFHDDKAEKIVSRMDYDFSSAKNDTTMSKGVIARTILLDRMAGDFIRKNPECTVINIACGMDTRAYRLNISESVRWYNIDLPETIEVRRLFLTENDHISMIAKSAMDESWADIIEEPKGRVLVIIEGLVMYLSESDVKKILSIINKRFHSADVIMEIMNPWVVKNIKEKSIHKTSAKFSWGIKSGKELEKIAPEYTWVRDESLAEGMKIIMPVYRLFGWIPAVKNISNKLAVLRKN
ncbi:MAG: class I SAM-dependent methyltransferase [Bacillus sp. (in: Bacteria)]|nr:class I SAM-dependent methyltransferase [Bacillus sp. (in: firmicutes)]MCM1426974.1 class I SAM-dependent methyltransferase [Eubacterium sp.]